MTRRSSVATRHEGREVLLDLGVRDIAYVLVKRPSVTPRVEDLHSPVSPEGVLERLEDCGASFLGTSQSRWCVLDHEVKGRGRRPGRRRRGQGRTRNRSGHGYQGSRNVQI